MLFLEYNRSKYKKYAASIWITTYTTPISETHIF